MNKYDSKYLLSLYSFIFALFFCQSASANLISYFKTPQGSTNWQYVANWSSGILILLLSIAAIILYISRRQINSTNRALTQINDELEQRVLERTATLDESNRLLTQSNALLEGEITKHLATAKRLHASESYIKSILESMPVMLVGLDKEGVVTQWNKAAEKITGLKAEGALNRVLWDAYPIMPVSREKVEQALTENTTLNMRHSQRGHSHYEITIYPLEIDSDTGVVILIDDVTKQVISENKLIERDKMSHMGELASTMAHDINVPLQTIIYDIEQAYALLTQRQPNWSDEQFRPFANYLADAGDQSQRTLAIIRNLLDFYGSHEHQMKPANIAEIMDHSLELARAILSFPNDIKFSDIEIVRDYEANLPEIPCFCSELQQVFLSLLRHSLRALAEVTKAAHKPKILIQIQECYDALWIKIQHNGRGLNLEQQQFVFEPYFSNESLDAAYEYDAGMRLSFPYLIITEHHEGQMAVTSDVEVGTTFHMQLQLKKPARFTSEPKSIQ